VKFFFYSFWGVWGPVEPSKFIHVLLISPLK